MAKHYNLLLLIILVSLISMFASLINASTPDVQYSLVVSQNPSVGLDRFYHEIGSIFSFQTLNESTQFIWRIFQQNDCKDIKQNISVIILNIVDISGIAYVQGSNIYISTYYIGNFTGDVKKEFAGVVYHMNANIWQWNAHGMAPRGLVQGIADFVRLKAGLVPGNWAKPGQGNRWDEGYDITARFLDYCNGLRNGFVAQLNKMMEDNYSDTYFYQLLGKTVDQLWFDYKAKYGGY